MRVWGGGEDGFPKGEFLGGVEEEAAVRGALCPCRLDEGFPGINGGSRPGGKTLGPAGAVEGGGNGAGGTVAGGDNEATSAEPTVNLRLLCRSHACFIRSPARERH